MLPRSKCYAIIPFQSFQENFPENGTAFFLTYFFLYKNKLAILNVLLLVPMYLSASVFIERILFITSIDFYLFMAFILTAGKTFYKDVLKNSCHVHQCVLSFACRVSSITSCKF